ncbi:DUF5615 family PIN-like protein [Candidatus Omnitrophota bacterium]
MKLLVDENIPDELVDILRDKGHDVTTPTSGTKDTDIAILAKRQNRIILTQDKDFANLLTFPPKNFHGIIRIKARPPIISTILVGLEDLFNKFSQKDLDKKLIILEKDGFRIRE